MNDYDLDNKAWRRTSRRERCPICGKPDWCTFVGHEGAIEVALCMRTPSDNPRPKGGWIHQLREPLTPLPMRSATKRAAPMTSTSKGVISTTGSSTTSWSTLDALVESYTSPVPTRVDEYHNRAGLVVGAAVRIDRGDDKQVLPARRNGDGRWTKQAMPEPRPLFRLPELIASDGPVLLPEGEKTAEALRYLGFTATAWAGGCKAYASTDYSPLAGREVVLMPDADDVGREAMTGLVDILAALRPQPVVRRLELTTLPDGSPIGKGGDAADWALAGGTADQLVALLDGAETVDLPPVDEPLRWAPMPVEVLPDCLRDFALEVARVVQVDPSMTALPGLVTAASAIGASRVIALGPDHREPSILWGALVAESGDGKTPAADPMLAPARAADADLEPENAERLAQFEDDKRIFAADLEAWKAARKKNKAESPDEPPPRPPQPPPLLRHVVNDITPERLAEVLAENTRLLCERDELSALVGGMGRYSDGKGAAERGQYLSMYTGSPLRIDRKTGDRRSIVVHKPHLSIFGGIQPSLLFKVVGDDDVAAGLPARFLWSMPPALRQRYRRDHVRPAMREAYESAIAKLYELPAAVDEFGAETPLVVTLDPAAEKAFGELVNRLNDRRETAQGPVRGALSKLRATCGRLALVLHCLREVSGDLPVGRELIVDEDTMRAAAELTDWFAVEVLRVFAMRTETPDERDDRETIAWIVGRGGRVTPRELQRGLRRYRKPSIDHEAVLRRLAADGHGHIVPVPPGDNGGRPTVRFVYGDSAASDRGDGDETPAKPEPRRGSVTVAASLAVEDSVDDDWEVV